MLRSTRSLSDTKAKYHLLIFWLLICTYDGNNQMVVRLLLIGPYSVAYLTEADIHIMVNRNQE